VWECEFQTVVCAHCSSPHRELLIFALMGVVGGLLGALIVPMNEMVRMGGMGKRLR
jgi:hypothetical protein